MKTTTMTSIFTTYSKMLHFPSAFATTEQLKMKTQKGRKSKYICPPAQRKKESTRFYVKVFELLNICECFFLILQFYRFQQSVFSHRWFILQVLK
jgi:hypothetical protein